MNTNQKRQLARLAEEVEDLHREKLELEIEKMGERMSKREIEWLRANPSVALGFIEYVVAKRDPNDSRTTLSRSHPHDGPPLHPKDAAFMDRQMGLTSKAPIKHTQKMSDGRFVMNNIRPSELQRQLARKGAA